MTQPVDQGRRKILYATVAGVAGLAVGGLVGYAGRGSSTTTQTVSGPTQTQTVSGPTQTVTSTSTVGAGQTATVTQTATTTVLSSQTITSTLTQSGSGISVPSPTQLNIGENIAGGDSTDPTVSFTLVCDYIITQCYEGLVRVEYPSTTPQLRHASNISVASDGVTWTATLNQNIKFATGDPVTAADYVYSWQRAIELGSLATAATDWMRGTMGMTSTSQVSAPDTYTLQFVTGTAIAPSTVMGLLATTAFSVLNQKQTEANTTTITQTASNGSTSTISDHGMAWLQNNSAGTGPYVLTEWVKSTNFTLKANPNYWNSAPNGPAHIPNILISNVATSATEVAGLATNTYDIAWDTTPQQANTLFWGPSTEVALQPQPRIYYMWCNTQIAPFNNQAVIQAMKWAIDYEGIVNDVLDGYGVVWQTPTFYGLPGADASLPFSYDPDTAKSMLTAAGYPNGFNLTLTPGADSQSTGPYAGWTDTVQSNLQDIGINVTVQTLPSTQYLSEAENHQLQCFIAGWGGGLASIANIIPAWTSYAAGSICEWFGWNDTTATSLTNQWYAATSDSQADQIAAQLSTYCTQNAPFIIAWQTDANIAYNSYLGGFDIPNPEIFVDFSKIYKV